MGFITTCVILNDQLSSIECAPNLGERLGAAVRAIWGNEEKPVEACPGLFVLESHHNSGYVPVLVGHGGGVVLHAGLDTPFAAREVLELVLLKRLATQHGFRLVRKPTKKQQGIT